MLNGLIGYHAPESSCPGGKTAASRRSTAWHSCARAAARRSPTFAEFAQLRAANVATLSGWQLTGRELALQGEHPEFGAVTLRQLLATWVAHDLGHIVQTARVMAKQYRDEVGPWRAYLSVMDHRA